MFGEQFWHINNIYLIIGIIAVLWTTKTASENARQLPGAYLVYNQPNNARKLYWYTMRQPMMPTRNQRTLNFQLKQRYANPLSISTVYANPLRNTFRNTFEAPTSTNSLKNYMPSPVSLPSTTSIPIPLPKYNIQPKHQTEFLYDEAKRCKDKLNNSITPMNFRPQYHLDALAVNSDSMSNIISPITAMPHVPYVAHTYFTLDDVVIPSSSEKLLYLKPEEKNLFEPSTIIATTFEPTTRRSKLAAITTNYIIPTQAFDNTKYLTTEESARDLTTMPWMPITTTVFSKKIDTVPEIKIQKSTILANKFSTAPPKVMPTISLISTINQPFRDTESTTKLSIVQTKVETVNSTVNILDRPPANNSQNYIGDKHRKKTQNATFIKLFPSKIKVTQLQKKFGTSKKTLTSSTTTTTQATKVKHRRGKTYPRNRKYEYNVTRFTNYNFTAPKLNFSKTLRTTPKLTFKQKLLSNVTETISTFPNVTKIDTNIIQSTTIIPKTTPVNKITEATTALSSESAIMTISSANGKSLRGSMPTFRKRSRDAARILAQRGFTQTTGIPQLPIEVYFTKLNKTN